MHLDHKDFKVHLANLVSLDLWDLLVSWDPLGLQDVKEKTEKMENPASLELQELPDLREFVDSLVTQELLEPKDTEVFLDLLVKKEKQEALVPTENLVTPEKLVHLVFKDPVDPLVTVVDPDLLDHQAHVDQTVHLGNLDLLVQPETPDHQDSPVLQDPKVNQVQLDLVDLKVLKVNVVKPVPLDPQDHLVLPVLPELTGHLVQRDQLVLPV